MSRHDRRAQASQDKGYSQRMVDRGRAAAAEFGDDPAVAYRTVRARIGGAPRNDPTFDAADLRAMKEKARASKRPERCDFHGWSIVISFGLPFPDLLPDQAVPEVFDGLWMLSTKVRPGWPLKLRDFVILAMAAYVLGAPAEPRSAPWVAPASGGSFHWTWRDEKAKR